MSEVGSLDTRHVASGEGSLGGFIDACIDIAEGMAVGGDAFCHCLVIYGAQDAHIEGGGVAAKVVVAKPCLVGKGELRCHIVEMQVAPFSEAHEAVECLMIAVGCAVASCLVEHGDILTEEAEDALLVAEFQFYCCHNNQNFGYKLLFLKNIRCSVSPHLI